MNKKFFVSMIITLSLILVSTICFAIDIANDMQEAGNNIRNFVGNAEDGIENAAGDISNYSKEATGNFGNTMNDIMNGNDEENNTDNGITMTDGSGDGYTARRTATTDDTTVMGMSGTAWTWVVLGIAAIAIIALVWYYSMQFTNNNHNNDDYRE